jgi:hypothetical protein
MTQPAVIPGVTAINPYGQDFAIVIVNGVLDFQPTMGLVQGRALLAQSLVCRQTTPVGSVLDCPNDCFDVRDWISEGMTQAQLSRLGTAVTNELLKDQRVSSANVQATYNAGTGKITLTEQVTSLYGPFALVLAVSAVTVELLSQNLPSPIPLTTGSTGSVSPF